MLVLLGWQVAAAQSGLTSTASLRPGMSLNGDWHYIIDPYETGYYDYRRNAYDRNKSPSSAAYFRNSKPSSKSDRVEYDFDLSDTMRVPGDWNTQKERLIYYEGTVWYKRSFSFTRSQPGNNVFIEFGAVNYQAEVYLNGEKLGTHVGGFTPFVFEISDYLRDGENFVVVKVDNKRAREAVPTVNTDWWNYGGITRDVRIFETPPTYVSDYFIHVDTDDPKLLRGWIRLAGVSVEGKQVDIELAGTGVAVKTLTGRTGRAEFSASAEDVDLWSPENPKLYEVRITSGSDSVRDHVGFRTIRTQGGRLVLNGKDLFLRGISIHEESPLRGGRAHTKEDALRLLEWAKELGCNFVRLAHYPHNENMVRAADELGFLVWSEIPVYWTIEFENDQTYSNAENQLTDMIARDRNRASVVIWSMANETPISEARNRFLSKLARKARTLDGTRLISAALQTAAGETENGYTIRDPFIDEVDLISFNQYIGWYDGLPAKIDTVKWKIPENKPVLISEFGAGAKFGFHGDPDTRWTEEFQEDLYRRTLSMLETIPNLAGMSPWILVDFRSPSRMLPGIQDGWNRKGLISEKGEKKKAFYVLQNYYRTKAEDLRSGSRIDRPSPRN